MYGLAKQDHIYDIVYEVCNTLGYGANRCADELLLETMAAETGLGTVPDKTLGAGMGIAQFDKLPFEDVKKRVLASRNGQRWADDILEDFGIDIHLVEWDHLRYNPLLSVIFMRLKYKLLPQEIPGTVEGRALYWKNFYNSYLGKGTVEHYIKASRLIESL